MIVVHIKSAASPNQVVGGNAVERQQAALSKAHSLGYHVSAIPTLDQNGNVLPEGEIGEINQTGHDWWGGKGNRDEPCRRCNAEIVSTEQDDFGQEFTIKREGQVYRCSRCDAHTDALAVAGTKDTRWAGTGGPVGSSQIPDWQYHADTAHRRVANYRYTK